MPPRLFREEATNSSLVVKERVGEQDAWKLDVPATPNLQQAATRMRENGKLYGRLIQAVSDTVKRDPQARLDVKVALRAALQKARDD